MTVKLELLVCPNIAEERVAERIDTMTLAILDLSCFELSNVEFAYATSSIYMVTSH